MRCNLAGGNWKQFFGELRLFARNNPTWKVVVYDHEPVPQQRTPDPPKLNKEIEAIVKD